MEMNKEIYAKMSREEQDQYQKIIAHFTRLDGKMVAGARVMNRYRDFCNEMVEKYEPKIDRAYSMQMDLIRKALNDAKREYLDDLNGKPAEYFTKDELYPIKLRTNNPLRLGLY